MEQKAAQVLIDNSHLSITEKISVSDEFLEYMSHRAHKFPHFRCEGWRCAPEAYFALKSKERMDAFKVYFITKVLNISTNVETLEKYFGPVDKYVLNKHRHKVLPNGTYIGNDEEEDTSINTGVAEKGKEKDIHINSSSVTVTAGNDSQSNGSSDSLLLQQMKDKYGSDSGIKIRGEKYHEMEEKYWKTVNNSFDEILFDELEKIAINDVRYKTIGLLFHKCLEYILIDYLTMFFPNGINGLKINWYNTTFRLLARHKMINDNNNNTIAIVNEVDIDTNDNNTTKNKIESLGSNASEDEDAGINININHVNGNLSENINNDDIDNKNKYENIAKISSIIGDNYLFENAMIIWKINEEIRDNDDTRQVWCLRHKMISLLLQFRQLKKDRIGKENHDEKQFWRLLGIFNDDQYYIDKKNCTLKMNIKKAQQSLQIVNR